RSLTPESRSFRGQWATAFEDFRFGRERSRLATENDAVWFFSERFDERRRVGGNHFQVQENYVQLLHLFLQLLVSSAYESVRSAEHFVRIFGHALEVLDDVL